MNNRKGEKEEPEVPSRDGGFLKDDPSSWFEDPYAPPPPRRRRFGTKQYSEGVRDVTGTGSFADTSDEPGKYPPFQTGKPLDLDETYDFELPYENEHRYNPSYDWAGRPSVVTIVAVAVILVYLFAPSNSLARLIAFFIAIVFFPFASWRYRWAYWYSDEWEDREGCGWWF